MGDYKNLDICYEVQVEAKADGGIDQFPLEVQIPITIGNIPFKADFPKFQKSALPIILPDIVAAKYPDLPTPQVQMDANGSSGLNYILA